MTTQRTYNAFGELASETASYQGNVLSQVQYSRDKLGLIISKVETSEGVTTTLEYRYDLAGRLVEVKQGGVVIESYEYDANGNRVQALTSSQGMVTGSYDDQDRLIEYGGNTYTYTANGELLTKTSYGQTTTYQYDVLVRFGARDYDRVLTEKYGGGHPKAMERRAGSEYSKIKKNCERG